MMAWFEVVETQTFRQVFRIDAADRDDALDSYLLRGEVVDYEVEETFTKVREARPEAAG